MSPKSPETQARTLPPFAEEVEPVSPARGGDEDDEVDGSGKPTGRKKPSSNARERKGTMDKSFKFPPTSPVTTPPMPSGAAGIAAAAASKPAPAVEPEPEPARVPQVPTVHVSAPSVSEPSAHVVAPSSIDVPPPPATQKERKASISDDVDEEVGATEEIPL
jgi:hypothetical protein